MKVGILTHYNVHNHGALLQLYALSSVLKEKGCDAKALQFKKNFDFLDEGVDKKYDISIKSVFYYLSYLRKKGISRTIFNIKKKRLLDEFKKPLLGEYYSRAKNLDAVFVGSDEVFSVEGGVNPYFFGIGVPCDNIFAYAGCCGPVNLDEIKDKHMDTLIKAGLETFKSVSVRDENTREAVFTLTGINPQIVCDPVILYGYISEQQTMKRKINDNYMVVYAYDENMNNKDEIAAIRKYAKENNLKIISVGFYHKWCDKCVDGTPIEILNYFKYSNCVVTDTFHGSVMSMITNADFVTKIRGNKNKLYDLLTRFELSDRIIDTFDDIDDILSQKIDYKKVNTLIEESRTKSMEYVNSCLITK